MQKAHGDTASPTASANPVSRGPVIHEDGTVVADDDASTRGVNSTNGSAADAEESASEDESTHAGIPTIRISTESNREAKLQEEAKANGAAQEAADALEKPVQAAAGEAAEGVQEPPSPSSAQEPFSFSNKRLCERWLDNLFMVLYEVCNLIDLLRFGNSDEWLHRICAFGQYSEPKLHISKHNTLRIERRASSGRFLATWVSACIIKRKRRRHISVALTLRGILKNHGPSLWKCTLMKGTSNAVARLRSGSLPTNGRITLR